jgi:hypothetical protein
MATKIGPKTVTQRDRSKALVFCIDAAHSDSYGGEPTTNLAPPDLADWNPSGTSVRTAAGYTFQGQPVYKCRTQVGSVWIGIDKTISGLQTAASGSTVCMSIWVKNPNPSQYSFYAYIGHDFSSTRTLVANSGWQKIEWTVAVGSMGNDYVEYRPYTNSADIYIHMTMPQVEVKAVSTPFTTSSRSATTAITNISGVGAQGTDWIQGSAADTYGQQLYKPTTRNVLATIDPNKGHIGGAYWDFDGSDEYIDYGGADLGPNATLLCWFKTDENQHNKYLIAQGLNLTSSNGFDLGFHTSPVVGVGSYCSIVGGGASSIFHAVNYYDNPEWHMLAASYDGTKNRLYYDGELVTTGSTAAGGINIEATNLLRIGSWVNSPASSHANAQIALVMAWSAGLTTKEIKDIYIAQKGRFGK